MVYSPWGHKESDTTESLHFHLNILEMTRYPVQKVTFPTLHHRDGVLANEMSAEVLHETSGNTLKARTILWFPLASSALAWNVEVVAGLPDLTLSSGGPWGQKLYNEDEAI